MDPNPPPPTRVALLTLQFHPGLGAIDTRALDAFLADKELISFREHMFAVHDLPHVLCVVTFRLPLGVTPRHPGQATSRDPNPPDHVTNRRHARPHPATTLDDAGRARFATLRIWRRTRANRDGVPPYVIFHDRELAAIAAACPQSRNALQHLPGIGPAKTERYADELLALLTASAIPTSPATPASPAPPTDTTVTTDTTPTPAAP